MSPSLRREWIEITRLASLVYDGKRLPPCGGSGLKSKKNGIIHRLGELSPSLRREWIEITTAQVYIHQDIDVSLLAEGVD